MKNSTNSLSNPDLKKKKIQHTLLIQKNKNKNNNTVFLKISHSTISFSSLSKSQRCAQGTLLSLSQPQDRCNAAHALCQRVKSREIGGQGRVLSSVTLILNRYFQMQNGARRGGFGVELRPI